MCLLWYSTIKAVESLDKICFYVFVAVFKTLLCLQWCWLEAVMQGQCSRDTTTFEFTVGVVWQWSLDFHCGRLLFSKTFRDLLYMRRDDLFNYWTPIPWNLLGGTFYVLFLSVHSLFIQAGIKLVYLGWNICSLEMMANQGFIDVGFS